MTTERKRELIAKAAKVLTPSELKRYADTIGNIEAVSRKNDAEIIKNYGI